MCCKFANAILYARPIAAVSIIAFSLASTSGLAQDARPQGILGAAKQNNERLRPQQLFLLQLLMSPIVQQEISLDDEQTTALTDLRQQLGEKMKELQQRAIATRRERDEKKRQDALAKASEEFESIFREGDELLEEILVPNQLSRLKGIYLQKVGPKAFMQGWVEDELDISESQRKELQKVMEETEVAIKEEVAKLAEQQQHGKIREVIMTRNTKLGEDLTAVLTNDQRKKFDRLKGSTVHLR